MATREGGSEWVPIKILSEENSTYVPNSLPNVLHTCCQDHVAITVLLTLGTTQQLEHSNKQRNDRLGYTDQHLSDRSPAPVRPVKGRVTRPTHSGSLGS